VYKYLGQEYEVSKKILELNPAHPILKKLLKQDAASALGNAIIEQVYDSALLLEGLHPDPSSMVARVQQLMDAALGE
jgi:molecular chaperone HtpG